MKASHLLITGIPGTGKTTIGDYLQKNYQFIHYNFEIQTTLNQFANEKDGFISKTITQPNVVISWGFMPYGHTEHVVKFMKGGFDVIWFDGNRIAAFREFMKRGTVSESAFSLQMSNICSSKVIEFLRPRIINTFDENGHFRALGDIAAEILNL